MTNAKHQDELRAVRAQRDSYRAKAAQFRDDCARLKAENEALRAALKPFADAACDEDGVMDSHLIEDCTELTEGHLRRAKAALADKGAK